MRLTMIALFFLIAIQGVALGQDGKLKPAQIQATQNLINAFKSRNAGRIADFVYFPLKRVYPLKDVKTKEDFIRRFDEIFDEYLVSHIANSKIKDWSEVGWRGIMLDNGIIWIDDSGIITGTNYKSRKEKLLLAEAIQKDKNQLPLALRNFEKPTYLIFTKQYKIRIDQTKEDVYRYVAWKIKDSTAKPELILQNGELEFLGSGGNHTITFKNLNYKYQITINVIRAEDDPDATLEIFKDEKSVFFEAGQIKRN